MSSLLQEEQLSVLLAEIAEQKRPPIAKWDPPARGHSKMVIKRDGTWWHDGSPIKKPALVKLFAQILRKEEQGYFLVTPVEKQEITVEDAPFVITTLHRYQSDKSPHPVVSFGTNVGEKVVLSQAHPLAIKNDTPYLHVRDNLDARLDTTIYYECVALAKEEQGSEGAQWWLYSGDYKALLGEE